MVITLKNGRFKSKINGILNNKNVEYDFYFINIHMKNQVKSIKSTYHYVAWLFSGQIIYDRKVDNTVNIFRGECVMENIW